MQSAIPSGARTGVGIRVQTQLTIVFDPVPQNTACVSPDPTKTVRITRREPSLLPCSVSEMGGMRGVHPDPKKETVKNELSLS